VAARFPAPVETGPGVHPASCTMNTGSFLGVKSGRGVTLTSHPLLVPWSRKSRAITLLPLWALRPVQSLSACTREQFTFYFMPLHAYTGQEVEAARISRHKVLRLTALRTGRLYLPPRKYSSHSFLLEAETTPGPQCDREDYVNEESH